MWESKKKKILGSLVIVSNIESMLGKTAAHDQLATEYTFTFNDVNVPLRCLGFPEFYNQYTTQLHLSVIGKSGKWEMARHGSNLLFMKDPIWWTKTCRWRHPTWIVHSNTEISKGPQTHPFKMVMKNLYNNICHNFIMSIIFSLCSNV